MEIGPLTLKLRSSLKLLEGRGSTQIVSSFYALQTAASFVIFCCSKILLLYNNIIYSFFCCCYFFLDMVSACLRDFQGQPLFSVTCLLGVVSWSSLCVAQIHRILSKCWAGFGDTSPQWAQGGLQEESIPGSCSRSQWEKHNRKLAYSNHFRNTVVFCWSLNLKRD